MAQQLTNKYFVRKSSSGSWEDVATKFRGVNILSINGFNELGETQNIYTAKWVNSQTEDFHLAGDVAIRANVDLSVTFIVGERYGANSTQATHDNFIDYICNHGDFYIKSAYTGKYAHVVCLKGYKPTTQSLHRGMNSYIMGTITLHMLDAPQS